MRYLLFAGNQYQPPAGAYSLIAMSDDLDQIKKKIGEIEGHADWWHVLDMKLQVLVEESGHFITPPHKTTQEVCGDIKF